jgi:hypothetical protein
MKLHGARLLTERNKRALLLTEAASKIGIHFTVLSRAENSGSISRDSAVAICDYYGLKISDALVIPGESKGDAA